MQPWFFRRNSRWLYRALWIAGALVGVLSSAVLIIGIGQHYLEGPLVRVLAARTGRQIRVDGAFEARLLSLHPRITASRVWIGNPPWSAPGTMASIGRLSLLLQWQPSMLPWTVRRLQIDHAALQLVRDSSGRANWHLHAGDDGAGPPRIPSLSVSNASVELHDERRHVQFSGSVSAGDAVSAVGAAGAAGAAGLPPLRITGAGRLNGRPATFAIDGDPLAAVRRERPYAFTFEAHSGATRLLGRGSILQPFDFRVLQVTFTSSGPDMKDLYFLVGITLPDTGPYHLSGRLTRHGKRFLYSDLVATSGRSDLSGTLLVDSSSARPHVEGTLSSHRLRLADLGARAADRAPQGPRTPALRVPDTPLHLRGMQRTDAVVHFGARALQLGALTLRSVSAVVSIDHGMLAIGPFKATLADGTLSGSARLDAAHEVPHGELNLVMDGLSLEQLSGHKPGKPALFFGALSGRVRLDGEGNSLHALAATANGTMTAVLPHGGMRASLADLASLNLVGALHALITPHAQSGIHCGVASFDAHDGLVAVRSFVLDTDKLLISGAGDIHMGSETLDLALHARPQHLGLALQTGVLIRGTLAHPEIRPMAHGALNAALAVVLTPITAVLSLVNPGLTHDADCAALITKLNPPQ